MTGQNEDAYNVSEGIDRFDTSCQQRKRSS